MLHRARDLLIRQRTMLCNALRAHLADFGIIAAQGLSNVGKLLAIVADEEDDRVPALARAAFSTLAARGATCRPGSRTSKVRSSPGTAPTPPAAGWRRSPASARSQRALLPPL
jgi:transposase